MSVPGFGPKNPDYLYSDAQTEEGASDDIVVIGKREKADHSPYNYIALSSSTGGIPFKPNGDNPFPRELLPNAIAGALYGSSISADDAFSEKHKRLTLETIERFASFPRFKELWLAFRDKSADVDIHPATRSDQISHNYGGIFGLRDDNTLPYGASLDIYIRMERGGAEVSDRQFVSTLIHELVHALGDPALTAEIDRDGSTFEREIFSAMFSDFDFDQSFSSALTVPVPATSAWADPLGGAVGNGGEYDVLVGSNFDDLIYASNVGSDIYSGDGNDVIKIGLGGGVDVIEDDGGNDAIEFAGVSPNAVSALWSTDGQDLSIYVNGRLEAVVLSANGTGSVERAIIDGNPHSVSAFLRGYNSPPEIETTLFEVLGTYQGYLGRIATSDQEADPIAFKIVDISGAYSGERWSLTSEGILSANFLRMDQPGSEFTQIFVHASDGVSISEKVITVRWGSSASPNPELSRFTPFLETEPPLQSNAAAVSALEIVPTPTLIT